MMRHPLYGPPLGNVKSEQNILQSEENIVKADVREEINPHPGISFSYDPEKHKTMKDTKS
ncbi:MAG: hypothetical protein WA667_08165 [Candidatus Nitrosopolaris sp.]